MTQLNVTRDFQRLISILRLPYDDLDLWRSSLMHLNDCNGRMEIWDKFKRGIYVFFEAQDYQSELGYNRIIRVGTHSIKKGGSNTTLWQRLRQHKGNKRDGGGNHRGSIFRLLVGDAIIERDNIRDKYPYWNVKKSASKDIRLNEYKLEMEVSNYIRQLPFMVIGVDPENNGPEHRAYLERNMIALLSQVQNKLSINWLGMYSTRDEVRYSKLWNNNHVQDRYEPEFLNMLEYFMDKMKKGY